MLRQLGRICDGCHQRSLHFGTKIVAATIHRIAAGTSDVASARRDRCASNPRPPRRTNGATPGPGSVQRTYAGTKEFAADRSASPSRFKDAYVLYEMRTIVRPPTSPRTSRPVMVRLRDALVCFDDGSPRWSSILPMQKRPKRNHRACQITVSYDRGWFTGGAKWAVGTGCGFSGKPQLA